MKLSATLSQNAAARLKRPTFLLLATATVGIIVWFYTALPAPLREADQAINMAILLGLLGLYLFNDFRPKFAAADQGSGDAGTWTIIGIILAALTFVLPGQIAPVYSLFVAASCFLRACGGSLLEKDSHRLLNSLFIAFTVFGALLVSLPVLDMPLRIVTGRWSAQIFTWLQNDTELGFITQEGVPMLLLVVNGRPFHVAAECNGFGLLGTCLLFTAAIVFYRRVPVLDIVLLIIASVFVAVVGNLIRIFVIITLAPKVGDHYMLMHEIVGTITFYAFLGLQWWLISGFGHSPRRPNPDPVEA